MPQVPEIPGVIPQVQPFERPVPLPGVEAPPGAFGVGIADAVKTFGGDVSKASDEVFSRALALRQLQVEGKLRDLTTNYYNEIAPIEQEFLTREGENASPEALSEYNAKIGGVQQRYAGMAEQYGPYGKNTFGADSAAMTRSFIQRATIWSGAQTREAQKSSINSQVSAIHDGMRSGAISEEDGVKRMTALEQQRGGILGLPSDTVAQNTKDQISAGLTEKAKGQLVRDPVNGIRNAQTLANSGRLNAKDSDSLSSSVEHSVPAAAEKWRVGAVSGQDTNFGNRKVSPDRLVDAIYANEGHTRGPLVTRGRYVGERALPGGVMPGNLKPWLEEAGMPDMTPEQYAADKDAQRQLMRFKLNQFQNEYGTANDAASVWFTGKPLAQAGFQANDGWHSNQWYISGFNKALARSASSTEFADVGRQAGNAIATDIAPNTGEVFAEHAQQKWDMQRKMDDYAKYDVHTKVDNWIINNAGKGYPDFLANPDNLQLLEQAKQVDPGYALRIPSMINNYNNSLKDRTDEAHLAQLYAMYTDSDPKFQEHNPWEDNKLSMADKVKIARLQGDFHRNGIPDPNFARAYNDLAARYKEEVPDKQSDPEGYKEYRGNLYIAMEAYQEFTKQPLKLGTPQGIKALNEIHQMLMQKQASGYRMYESISVPKDIHDEIAARNPGITEGGIQYEYFKAQALNAFQQIARTTSKLRERRAEYFQPRGYQVGAGQVPPPPPPPSPAPPARPWITAATPPGPPRGVGGPAAVELVSAAQRALAPAGEFEAQTTIPGAEAQEAGLQAIGRTLTAPETAPGLRAERIRAQQAARTAAAQQAAAQNK
jgi:hypothetical protein